MSYVTATIVFIHGAGFCGKIWTRQVRRYANSTALNLPGHTTPGAVDSIAGFADFVRLHLNAAGVKDVVLVGHSMGGAVAMQYALEAPANLRHLILVSTGARLKVSPGIMSAIEGSYEGAIEMIMDYALTPQPDKSLRAFLSGMMSEVGAETTHRDYAACNGFDIMARVGETRVPTLVICGTRDRLTPPKYSEYLRQQIKGSSLRLVEGAGHMVMLERPCEFERALEEELPTLMQPRPRASRVW